MPNSVKIPPMAVDILQNGTPIDVTVNVHVVDGATIANASAILTHNLDGETITDGQAYHASGSARLDPADKDITDIGVKLAVGRAIRQLGRVILRDGREDVQAQDEIRISQENAQKVRSEAKAKRAVAAKRAATRQKNKGKSKISA